MTTTAVMPEDKLAIHELLTQGYIALDTHNASGWADIFDPKGIFSAYGYEFAGREAIVDFIKQHIAKGAEEGARHLVTNLLVTVEENKTVVYGYILKVKIDNMPAEVVAFAGLKGCAVKQQGQWRFEKIDLTITLTAPSAATFKE